MFIAAYIRDTGKIDAIFIIFSQIYKILYDLSADSCIMLADHWKNLSPSYILYKYQIREEFFLFIFLS